MSIKSVDSNQARNNWREMLDLVQGTNTDVIILRYNKPVVTLLDYEDYLSIRDQLAEIRAESRAQQQRRAESLATLLATERVLARDWDTPEEDAAWQDL